ncbi:hypothetical protein [Pedobacter nutrimenti]|uniref:Uncharacterized protein n=1 Tax=Pedobacter nutrimenti TaxID=1241337 RepID=A0A318UHN3_9SPHI|nr:hypothetical protein [Pedobacter nutrimenti]PYF74847.1 hypothetical protein B0O44_103293 [Pedobacter nutrimenti]
MTDLISKENRGSELLAFGFPKNFVENIGNIPELASRVGNTDGAYFYLPTISNYKILENQTIVPIYDRGESFYVLASDHESKKIIHFELENDRIYTDYQQNWKLLLMDIMIEYFDSKIDDELSIEKFLYVGDKIGFEAAEKLFELRNLPIEEYNWKLEQEKQWRIEIAKELKIL